MRFAGVRNAQLPDAAAMDRTMEGWE